MVVFWIWVGYKWKDWFGKSKKKKPFKTGSIDTEWPEGFTK